MENSEAEANRSRDLATANMVALIFYVVVAVALVTLAVWSMTVSYMRRSSPSVPALPDRQRRRQRANPEAVTRIGTVSRLMLDRFPIRLYRNQDEDTMNQKTGADRGAARDPESAIPEMTDTRDATAEIQVVSSEDEEDMGTLKPRLENNEDLEAPCVVEGMIAFLEFVTNI